MPANRNCKWKATRQKDRKTRNRTIRQPDKNRKVNIMKNAFSRIGYTCASILFAGGLMNAVTPANAEMHDLAYVTLSQPTEVGSTTLPSGKYTISTLNNDVYLIRSENGE